MWDFDLGRVMGLMSRTLPFLVFRLLVYMGITLVYIIVTGGGAGVGWVMGKVGGDPAAGASYGGLIGFGLVSAALYFAREYLLYLVKAGHIAVLVELMDGKPLPEGKGQVDHAQAEVRKRFTESSVLFGVDQLIKGILKTFNRMFFTVSNLIPIPGIQGIVKFANAVINMSLTYLDEVILAYYMRSGSDNPWESSERAIILYAQNYKAMLKNAFWLTIFIWLLTLVLFLLVLGPIALLIGMTGYEGNFWLFVFAALLAFGLKAAIIDPVAMTALMQVFFKVTEGQQPDAEWQQKLSGMSGKFRELKDKAAAHVSSATPAPESGSAPPPPPAGG